MSGLRGKNKDKQYKGATSQPLVTKGTWSVLLGMADCLWGRAGHSHTHSDTDTLMNTLAHTLTHSLTHKLAHPYTHILLHTLTHSHTLSPPAQAVHILLRLKNICFSPCHKSLRYSLISTKKQKSQPAGSFCKDMKVYIRTATNPVI